jgi:predicted ATP-grasp superfamily ATP-dependent carboligase
LTQTSDDLRRKVVTLLQHSADLKIEADKLSKTADELRQKVGRQKDAIEKPQSEGKR